MSLLWSQPRIRLLHAAAKQMFCATQRRGPQAFKRLLAGAPPQPLPPSLLASVRCAGSPALRSTHLKKLHLPSGGGPAARAHV